MEATVQSAHHRHRMRHRHKKKVPRRAKVNPLTMGVAIAVAILAALFCIWQIKKPSQSVESLEGLQQFILLGAAGLRDGFLFC